MAASIKNHKAKYCRGYPTSFQDTIFIECWKLRLVEIVQQVQPLWSNDQDDAADYSESVVHFSFFAIV